MKISLSIADLPINISHDKLFILASTLGFDGIEIVPGLKTPSPIKKLSMFSKRYKVPILSVHHPFWIETFFIKSETIFEVANHFNALVVVHPLKKCSLSSFEQKKFMDTISRFSLRYNVPVTLENLASRSSLSFYKHFSRAHPSTGDLIQLNNLCKIYNFGLTFDTTHFMTPDIFSRKDYLYVQKSIHNIHISDFTDTNQHVSLGKGNLAVKTFIRGLKKSKYEGILTLELSPQLFCSEKEYFEEIKQSFQLIKAYS